MYRIIFAYCLITISCVSDVSATAADGKVKNPSNNEDLIIGGVPVNITTVPYQVAIEESKEFVCGGALISLLHVVTAASCIEIPGMNLKVRMGSSRLLMGGKVYDVRSYKVHEKLNESYLDYNVGVITLKKKAKLSERVQVIDLPISAISPDRIVYVTGWGNIKTGDSKLSPNLMFLFMKTIDQDTCLLFLDQLLEEYPITEKWMCAHADFKNPCCGDDGAPVVHKNKLVGVLYGELGCDTPFSVALFVNIADPEILLFLLEYID